jgi:predicted alpha/beta hydrolase family esterase
VSEDSKQWVTQWHRVDTKNRTPRFQHNSEKTLAAWEKDLATTLSTKKTSRFAVLWAVLIVAFTRMPIALAAVES